MDKKKERQEQIKNLLGTREKLSVKAIAEHFGVTGATIRADLREMENRQEAIRTNGIVSLMRPYVVNLAVKEKIFINAEEKEKIGTAAAGMIREMDSIIMTSGTTIEAMSRHVEPKGRLNVVTPSVSVALNLVKLQNAEIHLLGGRVQPTSLSSRDSYTTAGLEYVSASKLFLSCDGFDISTGVITATKEEAALTKAMMKASHRNILLADSSKLGKTGFGYICGIKDIDVIVTDGNLPDNVKEKLEEMGVSVMIA